MFTDAVENNKEEVDVGGTEDVSREFLYMEDVAEGILLATERYNKKTIDGYKTKGS